MPRTIGDRIAGPDLNTKFLQSALCHGREIRCKDWQETWPSFNQQDARLTGIDRAKILDQRLTCQLGNGTSHFHTGRSTTDHGEGQQRPPHLRVFSHLCLFESHKQPTTNLRCIIDLLEARRRCFPIVMAEIGMARTSRHHQHVIGYGATIDGDLTPRTVDALDLAHQHGCIALTPQDAADRCRDIGRRQSRRRHLIKEWLEQMIVAPVNQGHPARRLGQCLRRGQAGKAGTQDDDMRLFHLDAPLCQ